MYVFFVRRLNLIYGDVFVEAQSVWSSRNRNAKVIECRARTHLATDNGLCTRNPTFQDPRRHRRPSLSKGRVHPRRTKIDINAYRCIPRLCLACSCKSRAGLASTALAAAESAIACENEVLQLESSSLSLPIPWRLQFMSNTPFLFSHSNMDTSAKQVMRDMITIAREKTTRKTHSHVLELARTNPTFVFGRRCHGNTDREGA